MDIIPTNTTSFEEIVNNFIKDIKISGLNNISSFLENLDQFLYENKQSHLMVVKFKERVIQTSIGMLRFKRRYYFDTYEKKYRYLLDAFLSIPKRNRYMDSVKLKIIEAASEMSYEKAGRYGCEDGLPASKSTVCRLIKDTEFYIVDNNRIIKNDAKVHLQIDEKYIHIKNEKNQKRLLTATIFKGVKIKGKKRILQNRTIISGSKINSFFKRINNILVKKYGVTVKDEIYVSGDLATYIQSSPEKIYVCKAIYVPDKFHVEHTLKQQTGIIANEYELNDANFQRDIISCLKDNLNAESKKLLKLLKTNSGCLKCYLDPNYEGCSQECMNSHYYASRFDKVPNTWNFKTIEKLSKIIESKQNDSKIKIGFKDEFYDMPYDLETNVEIGEIYRNVINTDGMPCDMVKFFNRICDGYDAKILL